MNKLKILFYYWYYRHYLKFSSRSQFERWQQKKIRKLMRFILPKSPFYRESLYKSLGSHCTQRDLCQTQGPHKNIPELPIINKRIMMENFDELNTVKIKKSEAFSVAFKAEETRDFTPVLNKIIVGLSSGTSGNRGLFLISPAEKMKWVGMILAKILPGSIFSKYKIAFFMRANSNLYTSVEKSPRIEFKFFDLLLNFEENIRNLDTFQPDILVAPSRALRFIAEEQQKKHLSINPKKIISVADVLDPSDERFIRNTFQQTIHQVYQCTEGFLAATCHKGMLHLNEDIVHIEKEWVDELQGRFVPIITDFTRSAQPIVRYRLDDILVESKLSCDCGSMGLCLERIEGRCDDVLYCLDNTSKMLKPIFADFIRRAMMKASEQIVEYKVFQRSPLELEITYHPYKNLDIETNIRRSISELASNKNFVMPSLDFNFYQKKPLHEKVRRVERAAFEL